MKATKFAVIGLGRFGTTMVRALAKEDVEVIAVDMNPRSVETVKDDATLAVVMDGTNREALLENGLDAVDVAVVGIGENFEANLFTSILLKQIGAKRVIARAMTPLQADILKGIGIDEVVSPEEESARRLAHRLARPNLIDFIEVAKDHAIVQIKAPPRFAGKSIKDLDLRRRYHVNLVAIRRDNGQTVSVPSAEDVIAPTDVLVLIGHERDLGRVGSGD